MSLSPTDLYSSSFIPHYTRDSGEGGELIGCYFRVDTSQVGQ